ncbi:hypothetical protein ACQP2F_13965 [Actinoplanes sp. CA-030573]|uniref:hypothetical protein n=1 Tax=Actinoplanes sp. CA-030573 TaxID=3239898 RepID=UPI003D8D31B7
MRTGEFVLRRRFWLAGLLAALAGLTSRQTPLDVQAFADLGRLVLAGRLDEAYTGTFNQAGPLQLLISRLVLIGGHASIPSALVRVAFDLALTLGAMAACRGRPVRQIVVAVLALLWLLGPTPWSGHPAEVTIALLWAYAIGLHRKERPLAAAVALGVSVMIAPIGVLGFPCLLAVTGPLRAIRTSLVAAGVAVAGYLPFVLSGQFGMLGHVWPVSERTLPWLLGMHEVTWATRLGQAVLVAGGCALVAYLLRGRLVAFAAAPLAAAALRIITDPQIFDYYWLPVSVSAVLLIALLPDDFPMWRQVLLVVIGYVTVMAATTDQAGLGAFVCLAGYLLAAVPVERLLDGKRLIVRGKPAYLAPSLCRPLPADSMRCRRQ